MRAYDRAQRFGPILRGELHDHDDDEDENDGGGIAISVHVSRQRHIRVDNSRRWFAYRRYFTRARHTCALSGVSECTKSYHLITVRININSIFITLHLPLCGKSFCHFWHSHSHTRAQRPDTCTCTQRFSQPIPGIMSRRRALRTTYTRHPQMTMYFEVHQTNDLKQNAFTAHDHSLSQRFLGARKKKHAQTTATCTQISSSHSKLTRNWLLFFRHLLLSPLNYSNYDNKLRWNCAHSEFRCSRIVSIRIVFSG